jgi:sigma-B regulation protein RsbU (phosphoserine phosphatase)
MQAGNDEKAVRVGPSSFPLALSGLFNTLERRRPGGGQLDSFVDDVFGVLALELGASGMLVYAERRDGFELHKRLGTEPGGREFLPWDCPCLALLERHRVYIFPDPLDERSPSARGILSMGPAAGLLVGRRPHRYAFLLRLETDWARDRVDPLLNVLRAALGLQLLEDRVRLNHRQAAEVQESLTREDPPHLPGFEIACRSLAAEEIGGDFCDFVHASDELVGFAVGDASGHGLPAALLVRDVVTALRMGFEKQLRIEYVFGKLNRVIHRSNLSSRFVCVFYGELESNGNLHYVNAGHQPPLLFHKGHVVELRMGGTVIGPLPNAEFRRGFLRMEAGDVLVLFTDGVTERRGPDGEFFGEEQLKRLVQANLALPARELLQRILDAAQSFGAGRPWEDDVTLMVVRRCPS